MQQLQQQNHTYYYFYYYTNFQFYSTFLIFFFKSPSPFALDFLITFFPIYCFWNTNSNRFLISVFPKLMRDFGVSIPGFNLVNEPIISVLTGSFSASKFSDSRIMVFALRPSCEETTRSSWMISNIYSA